MSDEDAFQSALDKEFYDHTTRLVFADWLEDRGDPRAEGYRALGALKKYPFIPGKNLIDYRECPFFARSDNGYYPNWHHIALPEVWYNLIDMKSKEDDYCPNWSNSTEVTRRELENAVALAFGKLTPEQKAAILTAE